MVDTIQPRIRRYEVQHEGDNGYHAAYLTDTPEAAMRRAAYGIKKGYSARILDREAGALLEVTNKPC